MVDTNQVSPQVFHVSCSKGPRSGVLGWGSYHGGSSMTDEPGWGPQAAPLLDAGGVHAQGHQVEGKQHRQVQAQGSYLSHCRSQTGRQKGRQADRQTDRQAGRQTGRQTDRQTDRQKGLWVSIAFSRNASE